VIVVIGRLGGRTSESGIVAAGSAATIARIAAASGAGVQLVGKVGEGPVGDAVLGSLTQAHVGHVAVLRDATASTPVTGPEPEDQPGAVVAEPDRSDGAGRQVAQSSLVVDAGDLQLALSYLPDYRVVVVADPIDEEAMETVSEAARWAGAALSLVAPAGSTTRGLPDDATVLEAPPLDPDGAFAAIVGSYAAALDRGSNPGEAFATATVGSGWSAVKD
jgi:sugar/nucleoside kinase (ribokinase family)